MKTNGRHLSPQAQEDLRRRVVHAVAEQGMGPVEAARVFGVGRTSIHTWMKTYRVGGESALKARKRGPKPRSRLAGHEAATIVRPINGARRRRTKVSTSGSSGMCRFRTLDFCCRFE